MFHLLALSYLKTLEFFVWQDYSKNLEWFESEKGFETVRQRQ